MKVAECCIQKKCDELLKGFDVEQNLNNLHAVVTEARARKQTGYDGKDVWSENLHPGAAVRARTIPLLEAEKKRLQAQLADVRLSFKFSRKFGLMDMPISSIQPIANYKTRCKATSRPANR